MSLLLDTNVLSEVRKRRPDAQVARWFANVATADIYLSVLVVGEIRQGIERLRPRDGQQAQALDEWLSGLLSTYVEHVVPVTHRIAEQWGRLNAVTPLPVVDGLLAATCLVHGWTLVTRNVSDVGATGVRVLNPFAVA